MISTSSSAAVSTHFCDVCKAGRSREIGLHLNCVLRRRCCFVPVVVSDPARQGAVLVRGKEVRVRHVHRLLLWRKDTRVSCCLLLAVSSP